MEHFFYEDRFLLDLDDLAQLFNIDEDNVNDLKDDWEVEVELSDFNQTLKLYYPTKKFETITKSDLIELFS